MRTCFEFLILNHLLNVIFSREADIALEYEVVKCLKQILNKPVSESHTTFVNLLTVPQTATQEALTYHSIVTQVASSLNTPHLPTRKLLLDLLCFLVYWNEGQAHPLVVAALEALSTSNNESAGCYNYWFKSVEAALSGRGKMGSLVGASEEVRRAGGIDSSLNEYAVRYGSNVIANL